MRAHTLYFPVAVACLLLLAACQEDNTASAPASDPAAVGIYTAKAEELPIINELPGRIAPTRLAEVRPRVSGIVVERVFEQGSVIAKDQVLFRIDPAPFDVRVESAQATLARAQATQVQARQSADRQDQLRRSNVASAQNHDDAVAALGQANADVAAAQAGLNEAKLNRQYADVTAPISGRIGRALITEGALVSANGAESLATIQELDPIYADFTQSATDLVRLRKALQEGRLLTGPNEAAVKLLLDDGTPYPLPGRLLFSETAVDQGTGQITLRGEFPNPNGDLLPGMYVRVQIEQGIQQGAIAIPQQSVQRDAGGQANVLLVRADNKVEQRRVIVGRRLGDRFVVQEGIRPGDRVVADGFQRVSPGTSVSPQEWRPPAEAAQEPAIGTASQKSSEQDAATQSAAARS